MNTSSPSPPEVSGGVLEAMAKDLWERFAPSHGQSWEEETHKAEYRHAALSALEVSGVVEARAIPSSASLGAAVMGAKSDGLLLASYEVHCAVCEAFFGGAGRTRAAAEQTLVRNDWHRGPDRRWRCWRHHGPDGGGTPSTGALSSSPHDQNTPSQPAKAEGRPTTESSNG